MKKFLIIICVLYFLSGNLTAQVKSSDLLAEEEREAKNLAASFFNRFQETQDLTPLIDEYFVKDFSRRLKFCRTTGKCEGENRDFWREREDIAKLGATEIDFQRIYIFSINDIFLTFRSIGYLNNNYHQEINERNYVVAAKTVKKELKFQLRKNPTLTKFGWFGSLINNVGDDGFYLKFKTLNELHQFLNDYEKYLAALRTVETKLRNSFQKDNPTVSLSFLPTDFRIDIENNNHGFFDYPAGTRMLEVWGESDSIIFVMDLIKEDGKLKIVAIYPPID